jgi:hypothetical protein
VAGFLGVSAKLYNRREIAALYFIKRPGIAAAADKLEAPLSHPHLFSTVGEN